MLEATSLPDGCSAFVLGSAPKMTLGAPKRPQQRTRRPPAVPILVFSDFRYYLLLSFVRIHYECCAAANEWKTDIGRNKNKYNMISVYDGNMINKLIKI